MDVTRDYLRNELQAIQSETFDPKRDKNLLKELKAELKSNNLSLNSNLIEVMELGNHITIDENHNQSNFYEMYYSKFLDAIKNIKYGDKDKIVESQIAKWEDFFYRQIRFKNKSQSDIVKPVIQWHRACIGYYCTKNVMDIKLGDLINFLLVFDQEHYSERHVNSFSVGNALHELSQGVGVGLFLATLKEGQKQSKIYHSDIDLYKKTMIDECELIKMIYTPNFEFKSAALKVAWLYELGVVNTILDKVDYSTERASLIIATFIDVKASTIKRDIDELRNREVRKKKEYKKNHPLKSQKNIKLINDLKAHFKI